MGCGAFSSLPDGQMFLVKQNRDQAGDVWAGISASDSIAEFTSTVWVATPDALFGYPMGPVDAPPLQVCDAAGLLVATIEMPRRRKSIGPQWAQSFGGLLTVRDANGKVLGGMMTACSAPPPNSKSASGFLILSAQNRSADGPVAAVSSEGTQLYLWAKLNNPDGWGSHSVEVSLADNSASFTITSFEGKAIHSTDMAGPWRATLSTTSGEGIGLCDRTPDKKNNLFKIAPGVDPGLVIAMYCAFTLDMDQCPGRFQH